MGWFDIEMWTGTGWVFFVSVYGRSAKAAVDAAAAENPGLRLRPASLWSRQGMALIERRAA